MHRAGGDEGGEDVRVGVGKLQASLRNPVERVLFQNLVDAAPADAEGLRKHAPYAQR